MIKLDRMRLIKKKQTSKKKFPKPYPVTAPHIETTPVWLQEKVDKLNKMLENAVFLKRP